MIYSATSRTTGPNVFSDSRGVQSLTYSEPHHRWSVGGLYDNVSDKEFSLMNRLNYGSGHGWAGANYVAWNTTGHLICEQPPTAQNWAIGHSGTKVNGPFHSWNSNNYGLSYGYWESQNQQVEPVSLYTRQLADLETRSRIRLFNNSSVTAQMLPRLALELEIFAEIGEDLPAEDVTYEWRVLSGPGTAVFTHPARLQTAVVLDQPGDYEVELIARCAAPLVEARTSFMVSLFSQPPAVETTGGATEMVEAAGQSYRIHTFTGVGPHQFEVLSGSGEIDVLLVAGGGGGGSDTNRWGGAGGGGGGNGGLNATGESGAPNTGGGGGASSSGVPHLGGKGGSGIVIVRVPVPSEQAPVLPSETMTSINWSHDVSAPQLRWNPKPDASYVLQTSDDLVEWRNSGEVFHAGGSPPDITHTLPATQADRQFYRLVEIPQP